MREAVHRLMDELLRGIILDEGLARSLATSAHECRRAGNHAISEGMLSLVRYHRVKAMGARAQVAAPKVRYASILAGNV